MVTPAEASAAIGALTRIQGHPRSGMRHGRKKTSAAQLRYMRMLARERKIDVGPACCSAHSAEWTDGLRLLEEERHRRST